MTLAQRVEELTISGGGDSKRAIGEFVLEKKIASLRVYHPADRGRNLHLQGGAGALCQGHGLFQLAGVRQGVRQGVCQ